MIQIRFQTFETNSSSCHSLVFLSDDEYNRFKEGLLLFDFDEQTMISVAQAMSQCNYSSETDFRNHVVDKGIYYSFDGIRRIGEDSRVDRYSLPDGGHANIISLDYYC